MFYFFKLVLEFTKPCLLTILCLLFIRFLLQKNGTATAKKWLTFLIVSLAFIYMPFTEKTLMASLENRYPNLTISEAPQADAIVVLGGTIFGLFPPRKEIEELGGDRLAFAARLFHRKKAPLVLVSGGVKYKDSEGNTRYEAMDMKSYLTDLLVPAENILEENQSRNTEENYKFSIPLLKSKTVKKIILVTSAYHMSRAMNWFSKSDIEVIPFPTDYNSTPSLTYGDFIPNGDALRFLTASMKEYLGILAFNIFQHREFTEHKQ